MDDEKLYNLLEDVKPAYSFKDCPDPIRPDYSNLDNWAAYPNKIAQQFYLPDSNLELNKT